MKTIQVCLYDQIVCVKDNNATDASFLKVHMEHGNGSLS